jgi:CO/xanthine dehydrogenase Mo-binding subunit
MRHRDPGCSIASLMGTSKSSHNDEAHTFGGNYRLGAVRLVSRAICTNTPPNGAFRVATASIIPAPDCVGALVAASAVPAIAGLNCAGSAADETAGSLMMRIALVLVI